MGGAVGVVSREAGVVLCVVGVASSSQSIGNDSTLRRAMSAWGWGTWPHHSSPLTPHTSHLASHTSHLISHS